MGHSDEGAGPDNGETGSVTVDTPSGTLHATCSHPEVSSAVDLEVESTGSWGPGQSPITINKNDRTEGCIHRGFIPWHLLDLKINTVKNRNESRIFFPLKQSPGQMAKSL